jgi:hypothetical protein
MGPPATPLLPQVMTLHTSGWLDIRDRVHNKTLWSAGPFTNCLSPYRLTMLSSGQLVLQDKTNTVLWASTSACRGNASCYT